MPNVGNASRSKVSVERARGASAASGLPVALVVALVVASVALRVVSSAAGLYDHVEHWGKLVHAVDGFCATLLVGLLLLGWREHVGVDLADELAALITAFSGILFGVLWEIVEFVRDWVAYSDLQKSNTDTMSDFLCNDLAAVIAALLALRIYCHTLQPTSRHALGRTAEWLIDGPSRVLDRHGLALSVIVGGLIAAAVLVLWFSGRQVPGIPIP